MRIILSISIIVSFLLYSCEKETLVQDTLPTNVSFQTDILPMFQVCTGCHGIGASPDLTVGNAYQSIIDGDYLNTSSPEESQLIITLNGSSHNSLLNQSQKNMIMGWIKEGAQNN
jgi:hypothetical protein